VEEIGRIRPTIVAELMEEANKFADGEDAYNNKRGWSPEVDRTSKQKRRHRSRDNQERRNQVAAGYEAREKEEEEGRRPKTCYTGLVESIMHISMEKEFQIIR
jgi:hypothetical protein